jgi:glycosyltransferase involved in cell wall biosynthesis
MQNPLISIIIPTYNNGHFFPRLLESLLKQTYTNWEAIIIDNNSNDSTLSIISEYNDNRFKVFQIQNNGIIAKSRNLGIRNSSGEWIAFLDSDDWWDSDKIMHCSKYFKLDYDLIYHDLEIKNEKGPQLKKNLYSRKSGRNFHKNLLINGNFIPNSSVLIKKQILDQVGIINEEIEMVGSEDFNLWLRVSNYTNNVKYISKRLGYYYISSQGISQKNMTTSYKYALKDFINECNSHEKKLIEAHIHYMEARYNIKYQNFDQIRKSILFILLNGTFRIKLKSLYYLFITLFK